MPISIFQRVCMCFFQTDVSTIWYYWHRCPENWYQPESDKQKSLVICALLIKSFTIFQMLLLIIMNCITFLAYNQCQCNSMHSVIDQMIGFWIFISFAFISKMSSFIHNINTYWINMLLIRFENLNYGRMTIVDPTKSWIRKWYIKQDNQ